MRRIILSMLLIIAVLTASTPLSVAQDGSTEYDQLVAQFEAELTAYAATHTDAELIDYVNLRIGQMTSGTSTFSASTYSTDIFGFLDPRVSDGVLRSPDDDITTSIFYFDDGAVNSGGESNFQYCLNTRNEECRRQYNADLLTSAAAATALFAGCVGLTVGSALIACAATALAVHALGIAAAKERYQGCKTRAYSDCRLAYGDK